MSRLKKIGIVLGYGLLLMAIVVVICYAHIGARDHRESQRVTGFDIHIDGNGSHMLIDTESMYRWFSKHGVSPKGKSIADARVIMDNYFAMIDGKEYDEHLLEEAVALQGVSKQANRIRCATIGWRGLKQLIEESEAENDGK